MKRLLLISAALLCASHALRAASDTAYIAPLDTLDAALALELDSLEADSLDSLRNDSLTADTLLFDMAFNQADTLRCAEPVFPELPIAELPDSVYIQRLQDLPFLIEMPYNQVVRSYILRYVRRPKQLAALQQRSEVYFPLFTDMLGRYDLPYELCYLPVIESALNPVARSHMGAAGLWQFMPATGRLYGLEINSLVDERLDPMRSTDAACRFLRNLYDTFGDWNLAIAAYNCGPGNVNKAIHRSGGKRDFWSIYPYLPRETRGYLPIFIAAAYAMNYADLHGVCPGQADSVGTDTILTGVRQHLDQISHVLNIPKDDLRRLNPQYGRDILPGGKPYALCLPSDRVTDYIDLQDSILAYKADSLIHNRRAEIDLAQKTGINGGYSVNGVTYYRIKRGDTLGGIAKKFHVSVKQLKAWNGLKNDNIREGKKLRIGK
ncbi:MAG: transglycosylase SLT domain-containing protein [Paludibacteraceae bacterium]|nr:transglycosylase SLT domain-containing protein [Paludibacteraceae bacterium]